MTINLIKDTSFSEQTCRDCGRKRPCRYREESGRYYCERHGQNLIDKDIARVINFSRKSPTVRQRTCEVCRQNFYINSYHKKKTCSQKCLRKLFSECSLRKKEKSSCS